MDDAAKDDDCIAIASSFNVSTFVPQARVPYKGRGYGGRLWKTETEGLSKCLTPTVFGALWHW
jgi:hypothetical protein